MNLERCERCDDTGWERVEVDGVIRVRRCACYLAQNPSCVAGIPAVFASARLENFVPRAGVEAGINAGSRWLKGTHDLYLCGGVGTGKTRLACSLANEATRSGASVRFWEVSELIDRVRRFEVEREEPRGLDPLDGVGRADVLILDDLGAFEKASEFTLKTLLRLYNRRLDRRQRTIWTSNLTLDRLSEWLGDDRLSSRIAGAAEIVWLNTTDYRLEQ